MATLDSQSKAPVIDAASGDPLGEIGGSTHYVNSSDPLICEVVWEDWRPWVHGHAPGTATLTAGRVADGAETTLEVVVTVAPFDIDLGPAVPK